MPFGIRGARELEDGGCGDGDADPVRDDGLVGHVPGVLVAGVLSADRVAHPVAEVHACVAEADACERGCEQHLRLRFVVVGVLDRTGEVFDRAAQGLQREDVRDGVRALVRGAVYRIRRARHALVVGDRSPGLERVAEDVEARGGVYGGGHGARVQGVADAEGRLQDAVGDAGFRLLRHEVEDGCAGCFRAGPRGGGDGDEREEGLGYGEAFPEGRVDKVEEVGVREDGVEVHQFGGIDDRAATDSKEGVGAVGFGKGDGVQDSKGEKVSSGTVFKGERIREGGDIRAILGLNPRLVIHRVAYAFPLKPLDDLLHSIQFRHVDIRNHAHLLCSHVLKVHPYLFRASGSEPDTGSCHLKRIFFLP